MGCCSSSAWEKIQHPDYLSIKGNYFSDNESSIIYRQFIEQAKLTAGSLTLRSNVFQSTFQRQFPFLEHSERLEKAMFRAMTDTDRVSFEQYVRFMSVIAHGSSEEKIDLTVKLLDFNSNKSLHKDEVVQFIDLLNELIEKQDPDNFEHIESEVVVKALFGKHHHHDEEASQKLKEIGVGMEAEKQNKGDKTQKLFKYNFSKDSEEITPSQKPNTEENALDYETFKNRAQEDPDFATCFGLFPYIHRQKLTFVLEEASNDQYYESYVSSPVWGTRLAVVAAGFMVFFDREDSDKTRPLDIITLQEADVKVNVGAAKFLVATKRMSRMFEAVSHEEKVHWVSAIRNNSSPHKTKKPSRFGSFAPIRSGVSARYYTNGEEYFSDLAKNLKAAKRTIMIAGWHLTPRFHLTRHPDGSASDRIDEILKERAEQGVKIHILIWDELDAAFQLKSADAEKELNALHENIRVMRDPQDVSIIRRVWSHHQKTVMIDNAVGYCGGIDIAIGRYDTEDYHILEEKGVSEFWPGLYYSNAMAGYGEYGGDTLIVPEGQTNRKTIPRMPWHDIHMKVIGEPVLDLTRNFIERWEVSRNNWKIVPDPNVYEPAIPQDDVIHDCNVQVLRSAAHWSFDFKLTEHSLYTAHIEAIRNSKRYVFLESQFFIATNDSELENPNNLLLKALIERVERAHKNNEDFKVYVVTPLQSSSKLNSITRTLMFWQLSSSYRGFYCFDYILKQKGINADDYICMASLRNYARNSDGVCLTEMVYVHSKFFVVDDEIALIASSNINDRSFLGYRDSEIGACIENKEFAKGIRLKLFRSYLGLAKDGSEDEPILDPVACYDFFKQRINENSQIYLDVFKKLHENIEDIDDLDAITDYDLDAKPVIPKSDEDYEKLKKIKGIAVNFPRNFMKESWEYPAFEKNLDAIYC